MYSLVTAVLPKAIVLSIGRGDLFDRMRMLVQAIDEELQAARPGAATIATELATALFVMMLRLHFGLLSVCPAVKPVGESRMP
jgi:AraC family transcriptional activator of mtrCDE